MINEAPAFSLEELFGRLLVVGLRRSVALAEMFLRALGCIPGSVIDEYGCLRKSVKAVLVKKLGHKNPSPKPQPDVCLVDGGQLLYHINWPSMGTVAEIAISMSEYFKYTACEVLVIFDRYDDEPTPKDHELMWRAGEGSSESKVLVTRTSELVPLPPPWDSPGLSSVDIIV